MEDHCAQCTSEVPERAGYETTRGDVLCGPCYFALWGPRGAEVLKRSSEARRPGTRRPETIGPFWTPGTLGNVGPPRLRR